jgi:hypothetical protein
MQKKVVVKSKSVTSKLKLKPTKLISKTPKKLIIKKKPIKNSSKIKEESVEKILVENFVSLQKVMVNLSAKIGNLTNQVSQLLNLFEISAKSLVEKGIDLEENYEKKIIEKINNLTEQNKTIAKGITLLHEPNASKQNFIPNQFNHNGIQKQIKSKMPYTQNNGEFPRPINSQQKKFDNAQRY